MPLQRHCQIHCIILRIKFIRSVYKTIAQSKAFFGQLLSVVQLWSEIAIIYLAKATLSITNKQTNIKELIFYTVCLMVKILIMTIQVNFVKRHKNSPELSLLKFLPLTYHHSHFLAATLDFTSFFTIAFLRAAHFFYSLAVLD